MNSWKITLQLLAVVLLAVVQLASPLRGAAPPPPPPRLEDAASALDLTPDQREKVNAAIEDLQRKQKRAHDDFMHQLEGILKAEQLQKLQSADQRPPRPRQNNGTGNADPAKPVVATKDLPKGTVVFTGGYETDPRDHGRPVVLIAAALSVPADVFRTAFSGVTPASGGEEPKPEQVTRNKQALLKVLEPHGVTNDRLNEVSNYYRYNKGKGEMWANTPATATALITDGKVTGIKLISGGSGYSSPPTVSVAGYGDVHATVKLHFGTDFKTNGSIESITLDSPKAN
jgi:hypothetical protein